MGVTRGSCGGSGGSGGSGGRCGGSGGCRMNATYGLGSLRTVLGVCIICCE